MTESMPDPNAESMDPEENNVYASLGKETSEITKDKIAPDETDDDEA